MIENVQIDHKSATTIALSWEDGDDRYHVWIGDETLTPIRYMSAPCLYKNSKAGYGEPGYYKTRKLDINAATTKKLLAKVGEIARANDAFAVGRKALEAEQAREAAERAAAKRLSEIKEAAEELLGTLREVYKIARASGKSAGDPDMAEIEGITASIVQRFGAE